MKHLLQVEDTFQVTGRGLIVAPDIPFSSRFTNFTDTVTIVPPNSEPFEAEANFFLTHFNPGGFKLHITFPSVAKESLPIGSSILASEPTHDRLAIDA